MDLELLRTVFDTLPTGIVVLDRRGRVVVFNRYEERLARRSREVVLGRSFFEHVAPCMNVRELGGAFSEGIEARTIDARVDFSFPFPFLESPRDVVVHMQSLEARGEPHALLVIEDVSARRAADRMKEELASLLVHDLKNPLAVVLANLEFALTGVTADPTVVREALLDASDAARRVHTMLLTLLDIARLETSTFPVRRAAVDVSVVAETTLGDLAALGQARGIQAAFVRDGEGGVHALADADLLRRALENLLENAFRHAHANVLVRIRLPAEHLVELDVEDDGEGVPDASREAIFEKYAQVENDAARAMHNRGLGLTLVQLVARAHGGTVMVLPRSPSGSIFRLVLPCIRP